MVGGSSGIGEAVSKAAFSSGRYDLIYATDSQLADVRDYEALRKVIVSFGPFDYVVYSAGINCLQAIGNTSLPAVEEVCDVNYLGFVRLLEALVCLGSKCRLVAVSSDAAVRPMRTSLAYCASKAALDMAVRCAARELGSSGWRINAVAPGMTARTGMTDYIDRRVPEVRGWTEDQAWIYERQQAVIKRRAEPEEVADFILSVLHAPDYLNGSILTFNGGR